MRSVKAAAKNLDVEVIVVDNASTDGSKEMMAKLHPDVAYHYLDENLGFSKGNNYGIKQSSGELILLLNPDTVIQEDTLAKTIEHFEQDSNVGGLGIYMIDGYGEYLPESKRGLPTPAAAFYKLSGLSKFFPKSKTFGQYHVAYLDPSKNHDIEILSGAFMMMRKSVLDEVGLLDEEFFMYGEDIDLSYRIVKAGYKNRYCADSRIIHYKGESTKKDSVNYVFVFYRAMAIFAKKHFEKGSASLFGFIINLAIYLRAGVALIKTFSSKFWPFILDLVVIYACFYFSTQWYEAFQAKDFSDPFIGLLLPVYSFVLSIVLTYFGSQDFPFKAAKLFRGWLIGLLFLLSLYALLPEAYRFSRAVILIGSAMSFTVCLFWRQLVNLWKKYVPNLYQNQDLRVLVVGNSSSLSRLKELFGKTNIRFSFMALANTKSLAENDSTIEQNQSEIWRAVKEFRINEVIVDPTVISYQASLRLLSNRTNNDVKVEMLNNKQIIGVENIYRAHRFSNGNKIMTLDVKHIKRMKRSFDVLASIFLLVFYPVCLLFVDRKVGLLTNIFSVLTNRKTWVGYDPRGLDPLLPDLNRGVIHPNYNLIWADSDTESPFNGNVSYLESTPILADVKLSLQHFENLGV